MSVELAKLFPRIARYLVIEPDGSIDLGLPNWEWTNNRLSPAEQAAGYEEWADFFEWHLAHRTEELAGDRVRRRMVAQWTDDMAYGYRRCAAYARGEHPGPMIPSWERRPDLEAERRADQEEPSPDGDLVGVA